MGNSEKEYGFPTTFATRSSTTLRYWTDRAEMPTKTLLRWLELSTSKYHEWRRRYGKANEHNGKIPRDYWLEPWSARRS